jgi:hypothetical protein
VCDAAKKGEIWQTYAVGGGYVQLRNGYGQCLFLTVGTVGSAIRALSCSTPVDLDWQLSCSGGSCWMLPDDGMGLVARVSGASQSVGAAIVAWYATTGDHSEDWSSSAFG